MIWEVMGVFDGVKKWGVGVKVSFLILGYVNYVLKSKKILVIRLLFIM